MIWICPNCGVEHNNKIALCHECFQERARLQKEFSKGIRHEREAMEKKFELFGKKRRGEIMTSFSKALKAVKSGRKISRKGWNGKGMYVVYKTGYFGMPANRACADAHCIKEGQIVRINPYLEMKDVDDSFTPYVASMNDLLAEDWMIEGITAWTVEESE